MISQKYFVSAIVVLFFHPSLYSAEKSFPQTTGLQWYPCLEWTIKNSSFEGNPFDVQAKVKFSHGQRRQSITTSMFYDGRDKWKFRFTGVSTGEWSFETSSDDEDLNGWTGKIMIERNNNPRAHGFITSFGSKWGWQGTEEVFIPQYVMGKNPSAYLQPDGTVDLTVVNKDIREFVDEHGFTGFHIPVHGEWFDRDNPDPRVYAVLETIIKKVHRRGGACHIWLWGSNTKALDGNPLNNKDTRNLRYLAARLGPVPGWSIGYGFDTENGWASVEELDAWKAFLEERMGWDHFLGARVGYDEKGLFAVKPRPPRPPHDAGHRSPIADQYTT